MNTTKPFIDRYGSFSTYFKAEHMRDIIRQIKVMIESDIPYHVYASVEGANQLTILSRVIGLQNEKHSTKEIRMTVTPKGNEYLVDIHPMQFNVL